MASSDIEIKVKPHSHPGILSVALLALAVSGVSLAGKACPPVPVPAAAPAKSEPVPVAPALPVAEVKPVAPVAVSTEPVIPVVPVQVVAPASSPVAGERSL